MLLLEGQCLSSPKNCYSVVPCQRLTNGASEAAGVNVEQANAKKTTAFPTEYVPQNKNT